MDSSMNNFILDQLHVAQQSRREKLRVQHCNPSRSSHLVEVVQPGFNPDLSQTDADMKSSGFLSNFCRNSQYNAMENQSSIAAKSIDLASSNVDRSLKPWMQNNMENPGVWKSVSANSNAEQWNKDCIGSYRKNDSQGIVSDISAFELRARQNITGQHHSQFQYGNMNFASQLHYQNANSDGVTTAVMGLEPSIRWGKYSEDNEHVRFSPYGYQSDIGWNFEMSLLHSTANQVVDNPPSQGLLSLSLSSYPAGSMISGTQIENSHIPQSIPLHNVDVIDFQDSKPGIPTFVRSAGIEQANSIQEPVRPLTNHRHQTGPLGPFTGYATILKSSKFMRPAQQLLDEYCGMVGKLASTSTRAETSDSDISKFGDLAAAVNSIISDAEVTGDASVSAATHQDSVEIVKGASRSPRESLRPDYLATRHNLLYMLEEVSRRYKQYYQQMQMVVSAFESVAGLAGATPYIASALKSVSHHFNHQKNDISDKLRHIKTFLGEDFSFPLSGFRDKGNLNSKRLKYNDHSFQKHKSGGSSTDSFEPQQHIWRPQRGLPERAVSVLRAWLFEHFLHPYPTDTDKHMLATMTGLTRSQVSNWFINARVRLWKPMVAEVHMLETKGDAERNSNAAEDNNVSTNEDAVQIIADQSLNKKVGSSMASVNMDCHATVETHNMSSIDEENLDISRYHQTPHDISELGSISLTLGLTQSAEQLYRLEGGQHQSYLYQQDRIRQHLGSHARHEYAARPDG